MGTRGLVIHRFRGRYFVYYNSMDSYPDGLGQALIDEIPADPIRYKEWLARKRAKYARKIINLEAYLPITDKALHNGDLSSGRGHVDEDDRDFPKALCDEELDLFIEWIYTIDLDREIFSVNNRIHFSMTKLPHDRFTEAFQRGSDDDESDTGEEEDDDREKFFSFKICPEASTERPEVQYFANDVHRGTFLTRYQQYHCSTLVARTKFDHLSAAAPRQFISVVLFEYFTCAYHDTLKYYATSWTHDDFAFRETAFMILSLAAGQYTLDRPQRLTGHASNGFLVDPNDYGTANNPRFLPLFALGCHLSGQESGSAPRSSIYWFENVLVSLVPDNTIINDAEAAIAKAVEIGLGEGNSTFSAIIVSLFRVIMLEVSTLNGEADIKRTNTIDLLSINYKINPEDLYGDYWRRWDRDSGERRRQRRSMMDQETGIAALVTLDGYCQAHSGFLSLVHFFRAAQRRYIRSLPSQGCFPTEIYAMILAKVDPVTYNTCAKVSHTMYELWEKQIALSGNLRIAGISCEKGQYVRELRFAFQRNNESQVELRLSERRAGKRDRFDNMVMFDAFSWAPIIGGITRASIITRACLQFNIQ